MADFTYMGTKKLLAPQIASMVSSMAGGAFLDLFSGIAAVGSSIGTERAVWCNDVQQFSTLLTRQRFLAKRAFRRASDLVSLARPLFEQNREALSASLNELLQEETQILATPDADRLKAHLERASEAGSSKREALKSAGLHCLFSTTHGGTYFGCSQSVAIDSVRFSADKLLADGMVDDEDHGWMILALCQAVSTASNSTGHFAQYLSPNQYNIGRVVRKRKMDIWRLWEKSLLSMKPSGTVSWRRRNRVFNSDAISVLRSLSKSRTQPAVIYADPPYTNDQYSRYYHILENVILYDYPEVTGKGQYRPDRFTSGFSLKSSVNQSFIDLVSAAANLRSVLILSYPTNGLLNNSTEHVLDILHSSFKHVEAPRVIPHVHSTMGASKGAHQHAVEENIFIAFQQWETRYAPYGRGALPTARSILVQNAQDRDQRAISTKENA